MLLVGHLHGFPPIYANPRSLSLYKTPNTCGDFWRPIRQPFLFHHDLDHSTGPFFNKDLRICLPPLAGFRHRNSGNPLGALRFYLRGLDHQPLGKCTRRTYPERNQIHQPSSSSSSRSDRAGKCQEYILRDDHGGIRRSAHLPPSVSVLPVFI